MIIPVYISNLKSFIIFMLFQTYLTHIMVKLSGSFNEIDSHKKIHKFSFILGKVMGY